MARKQKLKSKKLQSKASKIINASGSEVFAKIEIFQKLSPREIYQNFEQIRLSGHFNKPINLTLIKPINDFYSRQTPNSTESKSLAWCLSLLDFHACKIRKALELKRLALEGILQGEYSNTLKILEEIDSLVGISIWSVITKASIVSICSNKPNNDLKESFGDCSKNPFLNYVLSYVNGYFTDDEIFFTSKNTHKNDVIRSAHPSVRDFFLYRFFGFETREEIDFTAVYNVEKNSSLFDIYHLVTSTLEYIVVTEKKFEDIFDYQVKHVLQTLNKVDYAATRNLEAKFNFRQTFSHDDDAIRLVDLYTAGQYKNLVDYCLKVGLVTLDFSLIELFAKSIIKENIELDNSLISIIIGHMTNVLLKNSNYQNSLEYLLCISNSFRTIEWFKQLGHFANRESANKTYQYRLNADRGIHLFSNVDTPKKHILLTSNFKSNYTDFFNQYYSDSPSVALMNATFDKEFNTDNALFELVEKSRLLKYLAIKLVKSGEFDKAEKILIELINEADQLTKIEAVTELTKLHIASRNFEKALSTVVEYSIVDNNIFSIFDTELLLTSLESNSNNIKVIDLPIAYALHSLNVDSCYDSNLKFCFENFLYLNNLTLPTELFGSEDKYGKDKLHYFLRWVCTTEVMKLYLNFETARQIEECRVEICNYLLSQTDDKSDLQFEIKHINKNLVIRKAVKQVENSRIYVDSSIFKGRLSSPYRTLFDRFIELESKNSYSSADDQGFSEIVNILSDRKSNPKEYWKGLSIIHIQDFKLSAKNATFLSLAKLMREEFNFGDKGINNYLSTRIRHGVLPTALRKSSRTEGLYFSEKSNSKDCKELLLKQTNIKFEDDDFEQIWKIVKKFTSQLEIEISNLNDKRLQIYTLESGAENKDKTDAMFNYSISPIETFAIQKELPLSPSYDDLVKVMMDWLWHRTDFILEEVKEYITNEYCQTLMGLFEELNNNIQGSTISRTAKSTIANAISRAKGDLINELNLIATWFDHVDSESDGQFELNTAIEIAKRSLNLNLNLVENNEYKIPQNNVSYWVDVFFILFENAISKSELEKDDVRIDVEISKIDDDKIKITCINNTKKVKGYKKSNESLQFYREAYGNEELIRDVIQGEGGTGLFKIWKIIQRDLNITHQIEFRYESNNCFYVSLELAPDERGSLLENTNC